LTTSILLLERSILANVANETQAMGSQDDNSFSSMDVQHSSLTPQKPSPFFKDGKLEDQDGNDGDENNEDVRVVFLN
jgi:hypothetical protein